MTKIARTLALAGLLVMLAACGNAGSASDPKAITIATGGTGGTYYPLGGGMAQVFEKEMGITATAQVTGASVENMQLLSRGEVDLAFTQNDIADYAVNGVEVFDAKLDNITGVAALYPEIIQLVVPADSDVHTIGDLAGKRVSVGAPGSGNEANSKQILQAAGLTYDDINEELKSYADSADSFKDGLIDAMFVTSGIPNASVQDIAVTKGVRVLSLDDEVIDALQATYPFFVRAEVPAGTYDGQTEPASTVAVVAMLAASGKLGEDFVYDLTKTLFEQLEAIGDNHAKGKEISLEKALDGLTIPIHPGAKKYYDEQGVSF